MKLATLFRALIGLSVAGLFALAQQFQQQAIPEALKTELRPRQNRFIELLETAKEGVTRASADEGNADMANGKKPPIFDWLRGASTLSSNRMTGKKRYIVTGATSGIGKAVAELLVSRGDRVVGLGRRIDEFPEGVEAEVVDLRDTSAVRELFARLEKRQIRLDGLVNAAGLALAASLRDGDPADWEALWRVNVHALALCCQEALPLLAEDAVIVNVSSQSGHRVPSSGGFYAATKFAVHAMGEGLRKELKNAGSTVRVATFAPGFVDTPILDDYLRHQPGRQEKLRQQGALLPVVQAAGVIRTILDSPVEMEIGEVQLTARGQLS